MRNKVLCKVKEKDRAALKETIEVAQPLLKLIQKCCEDELKKLDIINDSDYTNPAFPILRAYKDGVKKGLTKLSEYVIMCTED